MKKFTLILFATAAAAMSAYFFIYQFALNSKSVNFTPVPFEKLYYYQLGKLTGAGGKRPALVFVGDSSLGNSIDASLVTRNTGLETASLALTASFGLTGTLDMIKRAKQSNPALRHAVIMHTLDIYTRKIAGNFRPARVKIASWQIDYDIFETERLKMLAISLARWSGLIDLKQRTVRIEHDYINQMKPRQFAGLPPLDTASINPKKIKKLQQIAQYCSMHDLSCYYLHGPQPQDYCNNSRPFIAAINRAVKNAGLILANPQPLCLDNNHTGDSADHVRPDKKRWSTMFYLKVLEGRLQP